MNTDKKKMQGWINYLCLSVFIGGSILLAQNQPSDLPYRIDFQQSEIGKVPQELKVLSGEFAVRQEGQNRFLELGTSPLNTFGLFIGPDRAVDVSITARLRSLPTGKRFPEFGVGLGGAGGFQLWLMPTIGELQLRQGKSELVKAPLAWKPGEWVHLKLEVRKTGENSWLITGKGWLEGQTEPTEWMIRHEPTAAPPNGRASLWGAPYSEKPIQFDDVRIEAR